jgi:hypothetical protein
MQDPYPQKLSSSQYKNSSILAIILFAIFLLIFGYSLVRVQLNKVTEKNIAAQKNMSNVFYVVLPSNITDYPDNRPNRYRVHLPRPLHLPGNYVCALYSIQYPLSWPSTIGTLDSQWIDIKIRDDNPIGEYKSIRIPVPSASLKKPSELIDHLNDALKYAQTLVNTTRVKRHAVDSAAATAAAADDDGDSPTTKPPSFETINGAVCIRRRHRIICRRKRPIPQDSTSTTEEPKSKYPQEWLLPPSLSSSSSVPEDEPQEEQQQITTTTIKVKRETTTPPPAADDEAEPAHNLPPSTPPSAPAGGDDEVEEAAHKLPASTPPPAPADDETAGEPAHKLPIDSDKSLNVQNFVTVNVSLEPPTNKTAVTSSTQQQTSSSKQQQQLPVGTVNVLIDPFESSTTTTSKTSTSSASSKSPPKPTAATTTTKTSESLSSSTDDFQALGQLAELIAAIQIDYLKDGGEDDYSSDEEMDPTTLRKGIETNRFRIRAKHPSISHLEMSEQLAYVSKSIIVAAAV